MRNRLQPSGCPRSKPRLWKICVTTLPEAEEAVAELLERSFGKPPVSYTDVETRQTTVAVYLEEAPGPNRGAKDLLAQELERIRSCDLNLGPSLVRCLPVRRKDWAESWKRHFHPIRIGKRLLVKPSWSVCRPRPGQAVVVLDPGLSFGTGQHPTTAFCLQQLVRRRIPAQAQSFLDVGTGSGILAIAAAKLGYAPIDAFDVDSESLRTAAVNARLNRVSRSIHFSKKDITWMSQRSSKKYAIICANLLADLLLDHREQLLARLEPKGVLVLAGILETEFPRVQSAFEAADLRLLSAQTKNEWRSGAFCLNPAMS